MFQAPSEPRPALPGILRSVGRPQTNRLFSSHCVEIVHGISWRILIFIHLPKLFSPDPRAQGSGLGTGTHVTFSEELSHPIPRYILIADAFLTKYHHLHRPPYSEDLHEIVTIHFGIKAGRPWLRAMWSHKSLIWLKNALPSVSLWL